MQLLELPTKEQIKEARVEQEKYRKFSEWRERTERKLDVITVVGMIIIFITIGVIVLSKQ